MCFLILESCLKEWGSPAEKAVGLLLLLLPFTFIVVDFLVVALLSAIRFRVISLLV